AMTSVKKIPIEIAVPEFWKVERIPEATPRSEAGTLPMIDEELGEANIPLAAPIRASSSANTGYGKSTGNTISPRTPSPEITAPAVASPREPIRSDSVPDTGPAIKNPTVSG